MEYSSIVCTPYCVAEVKTDNLLSDISEIVPFVIYLRRKVKLELDDVKVMYPRLISHHVFSKIVDCLTAGESEFILVGGENISNSINASKGKFAINNGIVVSTGLRKKYQKDDVSFEFVFHSTDSEQESADIGVRLFGQNYLDAIKII